VRPSQRQTTIGILSLVAAVSIMSIQDAIIKILSGTYAVHEIVFVRSLVAVPMLLAFVTFADGLASLRTRRLGLHLLRGAALFCAYMTYYVALATLPLAETIALYFTVPLFVAALSVPILGERVGPRRWAAIAVGFLGMLIIVRPDPGAIQPVALLPVLAALAYATSALLARKMGATERGGAMAFSAALVYLIASGATGLVLAPFADPAAANPSVRFLLNPWIVPEMRDFLLMITTGIVSAFGFFLMTQSYRMAAANVVAPFEYTALPWGVLWGYVFFGNLPDRATLLGAAIIVGSGLYVLHRERRQFAES
jgi:drug/metabolite transporter (DMT)-like permease